MNTKKTTMLFAVAALLAVPAWADWDVGDPHKMHWPQLPDPNGYDVSFLNGALGDDFLCTETGPIEDIHIWVSFRGDNVPGPLGMVGGFVEIWSNVAAGIDEPFSHPGQPLWGMGFDTNMPNVKMRWYEEGAQRWLEPGMGTVPMEPDHFNTYQINIAPIGGAAGIEPFTQERGQVYWLVAHMFAQDPENPLLIEIGWKTSMSEQFMDDAVYTNPFGPPQWLPLEDPFTGASLDLAFVITIPEPATVVLLLVGVIGVVAMSRRVNE